MLPIKCQHKVSRRPVLLLACLLGAALCARVRADDSIWAPPPAINDVGEYSFGWSDPASQGVDVPTLIDLTRWVQNSDIPIFSILISRNGKIVYELYTSGIERDEAHYVMSVTKTFVSALVGVAIDHGALAGPDESVANALPAALFPDPAARRRFAPVTLRDVLGMSALDAQVPPHLNTPEAARRLADFFRSANRVSFCLRQNILPRPGSDFQYTDVTPILAAGAVEYSTQMTLLDLANLTLFGPMDFKNQEWMHEDRAGIDNGAYGLRLRPIDMQKFGLLFLNGGRWEGKQLLSRGWVNLSFTPWISSDPGQMVPNYGWYWWEREFAGNWVAHFADGWRGQRIAVFPAQRLVLTMTGDIEDGSEDQVFTTLITRFVMPAVNRAYFPGGIRGSPALEQELLSSLEATRTGPTHMRPDTEARMIPSVAHKGRHHSLRRLANSNPQEQP